MSKAIQRRRGTTAEHAGFTGLVGEVTVDTTKKTLVVHDGVTAGGTPLAKEAHNHDTAYAAKAHESSTSAHPEMVASDAEVDAGTGSKWVKVSQLIRATVKTISSILPITLGGTGASTAAGARTNLGLGSVAVENLVPLTKGGTGATTSAAARANLGLGDAAGKTVAVTPAGAADSGKLPALDATGKLPVGFVPLPDLTYVPEAGHATTADSATTANSATSATSATTAASATNADKVDGYHASQAANPNTIPVADATGKLSGDWLPAVEASTVAGYSPAVTPGASKIPVADAAGKLDAGWLPALNADTVDGYHAQKTPAADKIPVADANGKLDAWVTMPSSIPVPVPVAQGGTGATTAAVARDNLAVVSRDNNYNAVGSLCFATIGYNSKNVGNPGTTLAGSALWPVGVQGGMSGETFYVNFRKYATALSGTWRCLGCIYGNQIDYAATLWQRIS